MSDMKIVVLAKDVSEEKFFFKEVGTAKYREEEIRLIAKEGSPDFIVQFRGKKFQVAIGDLVESVCKEVIATKEVVLSICDRCSEQTEMDYISPGPNGEWFGASLCPDCYAEVE